MDIKEKLKRFAASRRAAVPAAAAVLLCGEGCMPANPRDLNETENKAVTDMQTYGPDYIMPIIEGLCVAADQDKIFGFDGEMGSEACIRGLWDSYDIFVDTAEAGDLFTYSDSERTAGAAVYNSASGKIGVNRYFNRLWPIEEWSCPDNGDGRSALVDLGLMLHEAAHKKFKHAFELDATQTDSPIYTMPENKFYQTIRDLKDPSYLYSSLGQKPYWVIRYELSILGFWRETRQAYLDGEITAQEVYDGFRVVANDYESTSDNVYEIADQIEEEFGGDWEAYDYYQFTRAEVSHLNGFWDFRK